MKLLDVIRSRRSVRIYKNQPVEDVTINEILEAARWAPSGLNNQPWRFVFVWDKDALEQMKTVFSKGNEWCYSDSMIVAVCSKKEDDCLIHDREYYLFDAGMATAFLILRATELGFVAHPIAGYSPRKTREVLGIPEDFQVITLVNVGLKSATLNPVLSEKQVHDETERPPRKKFEEFACLNRWTLS